MSSIKLTKTELEEGSEILGFAPQQLEKVIRLKQLLHEIQEHRDLKDQFVMKGGTALNLFQFEWPRLSVDIDLNYIGEPDKNKMLEQREKIEKAVVGIVKREGYSIVSQKKVYAATFWKLTYPRQWGGRDTIKIDLSFLMRVPLFPPQKRSSYSPGIFESCSFGVLDLHELTAGKLRALFERKASRDLYDVCNLLQSFNFRREWLRTAFVTYGSFASKMHDWRDVCLDDITYNLDDIKNNLMPMLRNEEKEIISDINFWAEELVERCRNRLHIVLPFTDKEIEFLDGVIDKGEIQPELLTEDKEIQKAIRQNPGLQWKIRNVRKHFGLET